MTYLKDDIFMMTYLKNYEMNVERPIHRVREESHGPAGLGDDKAQVRFSVLSTIYRCSQ